MANVKKITCPHCGKENTWLSSNKFKPFCSARCKLIDLGDWADESYKIAVVAQDFDEEFSSLAID